MSHNNGTFSLVNKEKIKNNKVKSRSNALINPIFTKIKGYLSDEYWISFMDDLSMNKFPKGFSYKDGSLNYRKPGKVYKKKLDLDLEIASEQVLDFFHEYAAKYSPEEKINMESTEVQEITWRNLKAIEKDVYINDYLNKKKT